MMHVLMTDLLLDAIQLLANEVATVEDVQEVKRILFDSPEGDLALASLETALGLELVPVEYEPVTKYWSFGPVSVEVSRQSDSRIARTMEEVR